MPRPNAAILDDMAGLARDVLQQSGYTMEDVELVGVGSPGTCEWKTGMVEYACNLDFDNLPLGPEMEKRLGKKVLIENDANAAAFGEYLAGAAKGCKSVVCVTIGTGIGSGILFDGKIYTGCNYAGAELGHIVIEKDGLPCNCGRRGCFEQYASATALIRRTEAAMKKRPDSLLSRFAKDGVDGRTSFLANEAGDPVAGELTWTGAASGDWNTTELNWVDENGTAVAWTQGANAVFNESATTTTVTLVEDIVAASCMFTAQVYTVTGPCTLSVPDVTVKQRTGRSLNAVFRCPLASPTGTLTKHGDGFVNLNDGGTLSNDLHVAEGRWTTGEDRFKHDITVTVDANAIFTIGHTVTIGKLEGAGTVLLGDCPLPKYTTITCDGNSQISNLKRYTHAVSAGRVAAPFAIPSRRCSTTPTCPPRTDAAGSSSPVSPGTAPPTSFPTRPTTAACRTPTT